SSGPELLFGCEPFVLLFLQFLNLNNIHPQQQCDCHCSYFSGLNYDLCCLPKCNKTEAKFCATLRQPSGTLVMTVTLMSREKNTTLFTHTSNEAFQTCVQFKAPLVQKEVQDFQVEVRGDTFYSKQVRKVMI
uniref:Uncharacterized protein n=1 Tax=Oreochromis niloticus TaxID=8128 RepID=A0A669BT47_ORENI